ncbi:MAG: hypothetical protein M3142_04895 [Bacteroidota bacterium]|nr:hypothetical protein [Bacteroidota bacterium]
MKGFTHLEIDKLEVEKLNQKKANQVLMYIDFLIDHEGDIAESIQLFKLKEKLLRHMTYLNSILQKA